VVPAPAGSMADTQARTGRVRVAPARIGHAPDGHALDGPASIGSTPVSRAPAGAITSGRAVTHRGPIATVLRALTGRGARMPPAASVGVPLVLAAVAVPVLSRTGDPRGRWLAAPVASTGPTPVMTASTEPSTPSTPAPPGPLLRAGPVTVNTPGF